MAGWLRRHPILLFAALIVALFVGGIVLAIIAAEYDHPPWPKLSDAGVTVAVVSVAGALVTASFRAVDRARAREDLLRRVLHEVLIVYAQIKGARRTLEGLGMSRLSEQAHIDAGQAESIGDQLAALMQAQLALETMALELEESGLPAGLVPVITVELWRIANWLNSELVDKWQKHGDSIRAGVGKLTVDQLGLAALVETNTFRAAVSDRIERIVEALHRELFGAPSAAEKNARKAGQEIRAPGRRQGDA